VARRNAPIEAVEQRAYMIAKDQKRALLSHLIQDGDWSQVLVFTRTKHGANRLTKQLQQDGIEASAIHGNKSQSARTAALSDFKNSRIRALVATEVASRGLDIKELPYVVNYELPNVPEDYVHRIGRTGRAGATGIAVSLVSSDESSLLRDVEKLLRKSIPHAVVPAFRPAPPPLREDNERSYERSSQPRQQGGGGGGEARRRRGGRPGGGGGNQPQQARQSHQGAPGNSSRPSGSPQGRPSHGGQNRSQRSRPSHQRG
jgi:ATP-dependent RNA helicase RhlE